jgi:hypothetical protein
LLIADGHEDEDSAAATDMWYRRRLRDFNRPHN